MMHFFEKRDRWGHGMGLWVLLAMVFLVPPAWWAIKQIDLKNDVTNWLPKDDPQSKTLRWYEDQFNIEDRILVSWKGSSLNDPRVEEFAHRLEGDYDADGIRRNGFKQILGITTPNEAIDRMVKYKVDRNEAVRRMQGILVGTGKLKVQLSGEGKGNPQKAYKRIAEQVSRELGITLEAEFPSDQLLEQIEADKLSGSDNVAESSGDAVPTFYSPRRYDFEIGWRGMHVEPEQARQMRELLLAFRGRRLDAETEGALLVDDCFFTVGSPVAMSVSFSDAGIADKSETLKVIRQVAVDVGIPAADLHMGGRLVAGSELNKQVKKVAWNTEYPLSHLHKRSPLLLSAVVGIILAFVMLRSLRLATLVLAVASYVTLLTVALVPLTNGSMNMVLVVMPTLLSVLTISAAIHVANYWKHAAYRDNRTAVVEAVKMARQPCTMASVTTAIGLISLATSPLTPVRDFGIYSAVGCLVALVVVLYGFPSLLQFWPARPPKKMEVDQAEWRGLGNFLVKWRYPVILGCLVGMAVSTYGLRWFRTETKVIRYFPNDSRVVQDYNFLEENLAGIIPVVTVVRFDDEAQRELNFLERMELVRDVQNKMRVHPEISGTLSLADFQPVSEKPEQSSVFLVKARYNRKSIEVEKRVMGSSMAKAFVKVATESTDLFNEGDQRLNKVDDEMWQITAQVAIMSDKNYAELTAELDSIAQSVLKIHPGSDHVVTGMVPVFLRTQQAVLDSLITSFGIAFAVIAVVLMVLLKNPVAGLVTMLPNLLPVGVVFGLISWNGLAVDIGTMITASVALGIAVDGTLHLITWFQKGIQDGLTRREAVVQALSHCGPAMWQTSAAVGIGLLMLYPADLLLIKRFGWLMSALIGMAFVADVIFLPALLAGPLGSLIQRTMKKTESEENRKYSHPELRPSEDPSEVAQPYYARASTQSRRILRID